MTGTGIVPPNDFSLQIDDVIDISIENIGLLSNVVAYNGSKVKSRNSKFKK